MQANTLRMARNASLAPQATSLNKVHRCAPNVRQAPYRSKELKVALSAPQEHIKNGLTSATRAHKVRSHIPEAPAAHLACQVAQLDQEHPRATNAKQVLSQERKRRNAQNVKLVRRQLTEQLHAHHVQKASTRARMVPMQRMPSWHVVSKERY